MNAELAKLNEELSRSGFDITIEEVAKRLGTSSEVAQAVVRDALECAHERERGPYVSLSSTVHGNLKAS